MLLLLSRRALSVRADVLSWSMVATSCRGLVFLALSAAGPARGLARDPATLIAPRVLRYDSKTDTFTHATSVYTRPIHRPTRGEATYDHGNRLTQYRFIGPRRLSGIYGAIEQYQTRLHRDPRKYRYRW